MQMVSVMNRKVPLVSPSKKRLAAGPALTGKLLEGRLFLGTAGAEIAPGS